MVSKTGRSILFARSEPEIRIPIGMPITRAIITLASTTDSVTSIICHSPAKPMAATSAAYRTPLRRLRRARQTRSATSSRKSGHGTCLRHSRTRLTKLLSPPLIRSRKVSAFTAKERTVVSTAVVFSLKNSGNVNSQSMIYPLSERTKRRCHRAALTFAACSGESHRSSSSGCDFVNSHSAASS